jgi:uncharacterized membrane protein
MRKLVFAAVAAAALAGCAHDPYHGQSNYTRDAVVGGTLGAVTGAAVGSAVGGRTSTIVGGALGAAVGTAIATEPYRRSYDDRRDYRYDTYPRTRYDDDYRYRSYRDDGVW